LLFYPRTVSNRYRNLNGLLCRNSEQYVSELIFIHLLFTVVVKKQLTILCTVVPQYALAISNSAVLTEPVVGY
jgi:hypothetical protein